MRHRTRWPATLLSTVLALSALGVPQVVAQSEPVFHLPFPCGEIWTASTRDGHSPSIHAVDFNRSGDAGAEVLAGADGGSVVAKGEESGYGNYVKVAYPGDVELLFAHLQEPPALAIGDPVNTQTVVGRVGSTGLASTTAHHLHYEQRQSGALRPVTIEGQAWRVAVDVADDKDNLAEYPGIPHTSQNCAGAPTEEGPGAQNSPKAALPVDAAPAAQWIEPVEGAKVGTQVTLTAWPTPPLVDGSLVDADDAARFDFHMVAGGEETAACSALRPDDAQRWSCEADLLDLGAAKGDVRLTFDLVMVDGAVVPSADGVRTVRFVPPPSDPMKYLRAGIPEAVRQTCKSRSGVVPPRTIAALDCAPSASAIETMSYFLMRPVDTRRAWQQRMDEYRLRPGGKCAKGKAGIESTRRARSVGCYVNEQGYANLRLAVGATCPAVYIGVLGDTRDIARLWKAYTRVAGPGWNDPGLGGRTDAPGCDEAGAALEPPGPPRKVTIAIGNGRDRNDGMTTGMRRACEKAGISIPAPRFRGEPGSCHAAEIRWEPARGDVQRYEVVAVGKRPVADPSDPYGYKLAPYRRVEARIDWSGPLVFYHVTSHGSGLDLGGSYSYRIVAVNKAGKTGAPVDYTWNY